MKTHNLVQGTPEWHEHRRNHFNASDAPAMLGISQYKTRSQLLQEMAAGIGQEFDAATEARFADGHRFEALARPIAEQIIGADLYPVTGSEGKLSASFDGLTMDETICFEHKTLSKSNGNGGIAEEYRVQMEQQLMISGAEKCLFMASKWDENDTLIEERHAYYVSDQEMRDRIVHGWVQFSKDLEAYQHVEEKAAPVADAIMALPALAVQIKGEVTTSNLPVFVSAADKFLAGIKTTLETDEDFVNAEANVKACKAAEDGIEQTKKAITAQAVSIDEVMRTMDLYKEKLANVRLKLNKLVESEKLKRKELIVGAARDSMNLHIAELQKELSVRLIVPVPDFALAMKGLKKLSAMQEAVDTALRNGKFEADTIAKDLRHKLVNMNGEQMKPYAFLFADLQQIIYKPADDFTLLITSRIDKHKADEAARLEAERARIQAEEEAKAIAKAKAESDATIDAMVAQKRAEIEAAPLKQDSYETKRPTDKEIIDVLVAHYGVSSGKVCDWILDVAEHMKVAA